MCSCCSGIAPQGVKMFIEKSVNKELDEVLGNKSDSEINPYIFSSNINFIIDNKEKYYDDIIRMNTSDRNKAKSTIAILSNLYQKSLLTTQLLFSTFSNELDELTETEKSYIIENVTNLFSEQHNAIHERGLVAYPDDIINEFPVGFIYLFKEVMKAPISINKVMYSLENVIDIIVHGEISSNLFYREAYPYPNSKLLTEYVNHLDIVNENLSKNQVTYLKNLLESIRK